MLPPSCKEVGAHVRHHIRRSHRDLVKAVGVFDTRCDMDQWPPEMRSCIANTRAVVEPQTGRKLNAEHIMAPDKALAES